MIKIFGYILIKATELPKKLTADDLELLLAGKKHLQKYPGKRKAKPVTAEDLQRAGTVYKITGE